MKRFEDFSGDGVPIVQEMIMGGDTGVSSFPGLTECDPIERWWCHTKRFTRAHANGSIVRLIEERSFLKGWNQ